MTEIQNQDLIEIGELVDQSWEILEIIGRGGYGEIYKATNCNSKLNVAIKAENTKRKRQVQLRVHIP